MTIHTCEGHAKSRDCTRYCLSKYILSVSGGERKNNKIKCSQLWSRTEHASA
jgi:hypothetical protein